MIDAITSQAHCMRAKGQDRINVISSVLTCSMLVSLLRYRNHQLCALRVAHIPKSQVQGQGRQEAGYASSLVRSSNPLTFLAASSCLRCSSGTPKPGAWLAACAACTPPCAPPFFLPPLPPAAAWLGAADVPGTDASPAPALACCWLGAGCVGAGAGAGGAAA